MVLICNCTNPRKGNANNPNNYIGLALTSIVSKMHTYILNRRFTAGAEPGEKMIGQAGFGRDYSTVDHTFTLFALVQKHLIRN